MKVEKTFYLSYYFRFLIVVLFLYRNIMQRLLSERIVANLKEPFVHLENHIYQTLFSSQSQGLKLRVCEYSDPYLVLLYNASIKIIFTD